MSPSLKRLINVRNLKDTFRSLHPTSSHYSRYYSRGGEEGATRIDRGYSWGDMMVVEARYVPVAFSDHLAYIVKIKVPPMTCRVMSVKARPFYKTSPEVVQDKEFQRRLKEAMQEWK